MELTEYAKKVSRRLESYLRKKPRQIVTTHCCCIAFSLTELSIIHVNKTPAAVELVLAETIAHTGLDNLSSILSEVVRKHKLATVPAYWLLSPEEYQLFILDSLPVKDDELRDALQWRIRSMVSFSIDETVIDYFSLPAKKATPTNTMIAAVVAKMDILTKQVALFEQAGLQITVIDVPELAMRNLTSFCENDEKSTAFIYFYEDKVILNITCKKTLYFSRQIKLSTLTGTTTKNYEQLSLDIIRYFDYFQTQWRQARPTRILVSTKQEDRENLTKTLSEHLLQPVEPFPLELIFPHKVKIDHKQLLVLGSLLREEGSYVTPGN